MDQYGNINHRNRINSSFVGFFKNSHLDPNNRFPWLNIVVDAVITSNNCKESLKLL